MKVDSLFKLVRRLPALPRTLLRVLHYRCIVLPNAARSAKNPPGVMEYQLVVARYNEDLEWSDRFSEMRTVYNKGRPLSGCPNEKLPNIGREAHTYLHHIIVHWNCLAEWTIFTQGDPFRHSPDFVKLIERRDRFQPVQPLSWRYLERRDLDWVRDEHTYALDGVPPLSLRSRHRANWIDDLRVTVEYQDGSLTTVAPYHYVDYGLHQALPKARKRKERALAHLWNKYGLEEPLEETIPFCYSAIFAVRRDHICARGLDFFANAMSILLKSCVFQRERTVATELERLWLQIFRYSPEVPNPACSNRTRPT